MAGRRDNGRANGPAGLALLADHGPSAVIGRLNAVQVTDQAAVAAVVPPDTPVEDRRTGADRGSVDGQELVDALGRCGADAAFDISLLAHRGESHALVRLHVPLQHGLLSLLVLARCSTDQVEQLSLYDVDDLGTAMVDLGRRWAADLPPGPAEVVEVCSEFVQRLVDRDVEAIGALLAPGLVYRDHRSSAAAVAPAAEMIELVLGDERDVVDLATEVVEVSERGLLVWTAPVSTSDLDHLDEELVFVEVHDGRLVALEFFGADQLDFARRRWRGAEAVGSPAGVSSGGALPDSPPGPLGVRDLGSAYPSAQRQDGVDRELIVFDGAVPPIVAALLRFSQRASRDGLEALLSADLVVDDRRRRTETPMVDRDLVITTLIAFGPNAFDVRLLAVRGDGLGVLRIMFERTEGGIADMVVLVQGDADAGMIERLEIHDTASFPDAIASLSAAHYTSLPPAKQAVLGVSAQVLAAIIARDYGGVASLLRPDFVYRDHRESMPTELGPDDSVALLCSILDESPDVIDYAPEIVDITRAGLVTTRTQSTLDRLGRTDVDVVVMGVRDGQLRAFEIFELSHLDRARRLLASWG